MFAWSPFITKYGKRPVYVFSFVLYTASTFGAGACKTWEAQLALRIIVSSLSRGQLRSVCSNSYDHRLVQHPAQVNFLVQSLLLISGMFMSEDWLLHCENPAGDVVASSEAYYHTYRYNSFLSVGVAFGLLISGYITDDLGWRYSESYSCSLRFSRAHFFLMMTVYWVCGSVIGALTLFVGEFAIEIVKEI
jgi:MFS family permease